MVATDVVEDARREQRRDLAADLGRPPRAASRAEVVTSSACESGPCSAWASRSAATKSARAVSSAMTSTSEGPAGRSSGGALRIAGDQLLGRGDPGVARPEDLVDLGNDWPCRRPWRRSPARRRP